MQECLVGKMVCWVFSAVGKWYVEGDDVALLAYLVELVDMEIGVVAEYLITCEDGVLPDFASYVS